MTGVSPKKYFELLLLTNTGFGKDKEVADYYKARILWTSKSMPNWTTSPDTFLMNLGMFN